MVSVDLDIPQLRGCCGARCGGFWSPRSVTVMDLFPPCAWSGSWNDAPNNPSVASAVNAMTCAIRAASALGARGRTSCNGRPAVRIRRLPGRQRCAPHLHQGDMRVALRVVELPGPGEVPAANVDHVQLRVVAPAERNHVRHPGSVDSRESAVLTVCQNRPVRRPRTRSFRTRPPAAIAKTQRSKSYTRRLLLPNPRPASDIRTMPRRVHDRSTGRPRVDLARYGQR
jgi:hypothetical protein